MSQRVAPTSQINSFKALEQVRAFYQKHSVVKGIVKLTVFRFLKILLVIFDEIKCLREKMSIINHHLLSLQSKTETVRLYFPKIEKLNDSHDGITYFFFCKSDGFFTFFFFFWLLIKLEEDLIELSRDRLIKVIFEDGLVCDF